MAKYEGETTKQMLNAPQNSVYIWVNSKTHYPIRLASKLGRQDLSIFPPSFLERHQWQCMGKNFVVIDHACELTDEQRHGLQPVIDLGFLIED